MFYSFFFFTNIQFVIYIIPFVESVDRTRRSRNHYKFSTPDPYDCRYPPPTLWKYHFCRSTSLRVSRRRSNTANYGKQTTSLPKTINSLISNVHNNNIILYTPSVMVSGVRRIFQRELWRGGG